MGFPFSAVLLFWMAGAGCAWGWGPEGHILVAEIAQRFLTPAAQARLRTEFNINRLARVANWADRIKSQRPETRPWHYTNLPRGERRYRPERDCPAGDCVTEMIPRMAQRLAEPGGTPRRRLEALMFLVHLVGDVHQPMHLGNPEDRGGNEIPLRWKGRPTNLHALWDHDLIETGGRSLLQYASVLADRITPGEVREWTPSTAREWTEESRRWVLEAGYPLRLNPLGEPSREYLETARRLVRRQLQKAGVRLAALLNRLLDSPQPLTGN